jgi:hypothetical protein
MRHGLATGKHQTDLPDEANQLLDFTRIYPAPPAANFSLPFFRSVGARTCFVGTARPGMTMYA